MVGSKKAKAGACVIDEAFKIATRTTKGVADRRIMNADATAAGRHTGSQLAPTLARNAAAGTQFLF